MKNELELAIKNLDKIMQPKIISNFLGKYSPVFHHSNEILSYIPNNLKDKNVLTITGSGDQLFTIINNKCESVDTFDVNYYTILYTKLRIVAIKYLSKEDLYKYFNNNQITNYFFNFNIYMKFRNYLDFETKYFFDYLYTHYPIDNIKNLFFYSDKIQNLDYLNNIDFIKNRLKEININHYNSDFYLLESKIRDKKYDYIFLSNISKYIHDPIIFYKYIKVLSNYLNDNGQIYYAYNLNFNVDNNIEGIRNINLDFDTKYFKYITEEILNNTSLINLIDMNNDRKAYVLKYTKKL